MTHPDDLPGWFPPNEAIRYADAFGRAMQAAAGVASLVLHWVNAFRHSIDAENPRPIPYDVFLTQHIGALSAGMSALDKGDVEGCAHLIGGDNAPG